ncbi:MAG: hypothetical protein V3S49_04485 [Thermodesulfobacteriota bacterium]
MIKEIIVVIRKLNKHFFFIYFGWRKLNSINDFNEWITPDMEGDKKVSGGKEQVGKRRQWELSGKTRTSGQLLSPATKEPPFIFFLKSIRKRDVLLISKADDTTHTSQNMTLIVEPIITLEDLTLVIKILRSIQIILGIFLNMKH